MLDDLGVKEILDDAFGDIDGSAGLDESRDAEGAEPRTIEPTPRSKVEEKRKIAKKSEISILLRVTSPKMKRAKLLQWSIRGLEKIEP